MAEDLKTESPTLQEGKPAQTQGKNEEEIQALLDTLDRVGVKTPQHIEGVVANAREFGNVSNLLGQERHRAQDLERRLAELEARPTPKKDSYDYSAVESNTPVDLESVIAKVVRKENEVRDARMAEVQRRQFEAWKTINSDTDYRNVKSVWEDKLKDPDLIMRIQTGMTDPVREYHETVRDFYKGLAMQAKTVIEQYKGKGAVTPPHVETGERGGNVVSEGAGEPPVQLKRFNELKQKVSNGGILSSEEEMELARIATFGLFPTSPAPPPQRRQ